LLQQQHSSADADFESGTQRRSFDIARDYMLALFRRNLALMTLTYRREI